MHDDTRELVEWLVREGADILFSLNGGHIAPIYDACLDLGLRILDVRHEDARVLRRAVRAGIDVHIVAAPDAPAP